MKFQRFDWTKVCLKGQEGAGGQKVSETKKLMEADKNCFEGAVRQRLQLFAYKIEKRKKMRGVMETLKNRVAKLLKDTSLFCDDQMLECLDPLEELEFLKLYDQTSVFQTVATKLCASLARLSGGMTKSDKAVRVLQNSYRSRFEPANLNSEDEIEVLKDVPATRHPPPKVHFCVCGHTNKTLRSFLKHAKECSQYAKWNTGDHERGKAPKNDKCLICQDQMDLASEATTWFPCMHVYHRDCTLKLGVVEGENVEWKCCICRTRVSLRGEYRKLVQANLAPQDKGKLHLNMAMGGNGSITIATP